ncbi:ABC transporter permease [Williamsia sp.]|uniref:ABC transporter permease n=1 Tax=Williamsia sp. TaxID=1872085 RepID=UPI002F95CB38
MISAATLPAPTAAARTGILLRFHLRRNRSMVLWWTIGIVALYYATAAGVDSLYPTQADLDSAAAAMSANNAFVAMAGPPRALDTVGGQTAWQASAFGSVAIGLMAMFLVGRTTREDEERGRSELVLALPVGRLATATAAAILTAGATVLVGVLITASLVAFGLPVAGSVSLGLSAALAGMVFGSATAVMAQVFPTTRGVYAASGGLIGAAYVLRAIGDVGNGVLSWLSPIGWGQAMRPYAGEIWWPALLSVVAVVISAVLVVMMFDRRDEGAGLWTPGPGPSTAGRTLSGPVGLAWRLQRGSIVGWSFGMLLCGFAYGTIGDDVEPVIGDSGYASDLFGQAGPSLTDSFYASSVLMLALIASGFAVSSAMRPHREESEGRTEALLATGLSRLRWAGAHGLMTLAGALLALVATGIGLGLGYGTFTGDWSETGSLAGAPIAYLPALLCLSGVVAVVYGWANRYTAIAWIGLVFCVAIYVLAPVLRIPEWVSNISPFSHVPQVPAVDLDLVPLLWLAAVAVILTAAGTLGLMRRDMD